MGVSSDQHLDNSMHTCLICENLIEPFMSFGKMPLANGFLTPEDYSKEHFFEMKVAACSKCKLVQLTEQPDRTKMFNDTYAFFSGTSKHMEQHFKGFAEHVLNDFIHSSDPFVVEIGSNDGTMLKNFSQRKIRHLGIEPSVNVANVARERGVKTISKFFDRELASEIVRENGQADAFIAANVMCHIPYLHSVVEGIKILVKPDGIVAFEDPYLGDVIQKTSYDQLYDAHVFLFSVSAINCLFGQHDMEVIEVEPQKTHGGSMRYIIAHKGARPVGSSVREQLRLEEELGLGQASTYEEFRKRCEKSRGDLRQLLTRLKQEGKRVVGYAASAKSTTVCNYCQITPELLDSICDTTPIKQGRQSPGMHIPVVPYEQFSVSFPDYALLFGWNHYEEIMAKEESFRRAGGKWILHVPHVRVLE